MEKKFYDFTLAEVGMTAGFEFINKTLGGPTAESSSLNDIKQGTGEEERIGRKCTIRNINIRLTLHWIPAASSDLTEADDTSITVRLVLYCDKQCNGAAAAALDLFDTNVYNSYRNLANITRFKFLYDKLLTFNTTAIAAGNGTANDSARIIKAFQVRISKRVNIPIEFDSTTGDISEIRSNNIGLFMGTNDSGEMSVSASTCRIRFTDF